MPESRSLSLAEDLADHRSYDLIEQAMMESVRGRRFLAEFVRRHRSADTTMLLDAMGRLEQAVAREHVPAERESRTLTAWGGEPDPADAAPSASKLPSHKTGPFAGPESDPGTIATAARRAAADLLGEAETLQETAWRLRESGAAAKLCTELDRCATRIYAACSSQEALVQQMESVVETLRRQKARTSALHGQNEHAGASRQDRATDRHPGSDAERLRDLARRFRHDPSEFGAHAALTPEDLDRLTIEERLALFS